MTHPTADVTVRTMGRGGGPRGVLLVSLLLLATPLGGCASTQSTQPPPTAPALALAPAEDVRATLGRIGIPAKGAVPLGVWTMPAKGAAAGAGRVAATIKPVDAPGVLLWPLAVAIGAVVGAVAAEPAAVVEEAEATIKAGFASLQLQETLRQRVAQVAHAEADRTIAVQAATGTPAEEPTGPWDTALEIDIPGYGTKAAPTVNPPVHLFLEAHVRLVRVADDRLLYRRSLLWVSPGRPLAEWAATQGEPVRQALERGLQELAERIVDVVFLLGAVP